MPSLATKMQELSEEGGHVMTPTLTPSTTGLFIPTILRWGCVAKAKAFIIPVAVGNFIDQALASKLGLPIKGLPYPILVMTLDGRLHSAGPVCTQISPVVYYLATGTEHQAFVILHYLGPQVSAGPGVSMVEGPQPPG